MFIGITKSQFKRWPYVMAFTVYSLILMLDIWDPLGMISWVYYVIPLLLASPTRDRKALAILLILSYAGLAVGYQLSPPGVDRSIALMNRG